MAGLATRGWTGDAAWDSTIAAAALANLRMAGVDGFSPSRADFDEIDGNGWQSYHDANHSADASVFSPHYQSWIWAVFLKCYDVSGYTPFKDRATRAIRDMMDNYPTMWQATANGITMQRARMLLPLAWLVRVDGTAESAEWLARVADGLLARQAPSGFFREEISAEGWGGAAQTPNNENYGTFESPLNQNNSDPVADLLYTQNFAFAGLVEAAAATNNATYAAAADKLADALVRAQATGAAAAGAPQEWSQPTLEGAWPRAFDFDKWDYWGSDADAGWGAFSTETGWTTTWITHSLVLRGAATSLWDVAGAAPELRDEILGWVPWFFPEDDA